MNCSQMSSKRGLILKCFSTYVATDLLLKSTVFGHNMSLGIRFLYKIFSTDATFSFAILFGFNVIFSNKTLDRQQLKDCIGKTKENTDIGQLYYLFCLTNSMSLPHVCLHGLISSVCLVALGTCGRSRFTMNNQNVSLTV